MRLTEDQIRRGILHPEQLVRGAAVRYFVDSFSSDPNVMPLVIEAVETYGWPDAFEFLARFANLAQTDDTLLWLIDELDKVGRPGNMDEANHCLRLSLVISGADVGLLMRHEARVVTLGGFFADHRKRVGERIRLLSTDTDTCWQELERFCEEEKEKHFINDVDLGHASRLVEAIARDGTRADQVLAILSQKIENYENNPMLWMEPLAARLAGELRLEAALPLLIAKLHEDVGDLLNEECMRAFVKIGTDAAVEAICRDFAAAAWSYRLYASAAMENIRSDTVVPRSLDLLGQEDDSTVKMNLLHAMLNSFSSDGIEPAREAVNRRILEPRRRLVAVATLMGIGFPELDPWMAEETKAAKARKSRYHEMILGAPRSQPQPQPQPKPKPKPRAYTDALAPKPQLPIAGQKRVGRNDPCSCGSGKKYKKCCMNKNR